MSWVKMMMFDNGTELGIRCRFISEWYKIDTFVSGRACLLIVSVVYVIRDFPV